MFNEKAAVHLLAEKVLGSVERVTIKPGIGDARSYGDFERALSTLKFPAKAWVEVAFEHGMTTKNLSAGDSAEEFFAEYWRWRNALGGAMLKSVMAAVEDEDVRKALGFKKDVGEFTIADMRNGGVKSLSFREKKDKKEKKDEK